MGNELQSLAGDLCYCSYRVDEQNIEVNGSPISDSDVPLVAGKTLFLI